MMFEVGCLMSDVGYETKAKRSSEIAVYKNYGNLFSPARNATHSAAGAGRRSWRATKHARKLAGFQNKL